MFQFCPCLREDLLVLLRAFLGIPEAAPRRSRREAAMEVGSSLGVASRTSSGKRSWQLGSLWLINQDGITSCCSLIFGIINFFKWNLASIVIELIMNAMAKRFPSWRQWKREKAGLQLSGATQVAFQLVERKILLQLRHITWWLSKVPRSQPRAPMKEWFYKLKNIGGKKIEHRCRTTWRNVGSLWIFV